MTHAVTTGTGTTPRLAANACQASRPTAMPAGTPAASLAADAGVIAFKTAYARWVSEPEEQDLSQLIRESLDQLKVLTAGT
jgi:hypothetical protein